MKYNELKSKYSNSFEQFATIVKESANQLFRQEFELELDFSDVQDTQKLIMNERFPCVQIRFVSIGEQQIRHLITLETDFVLKLYAWMIDTEPESSINNEHLEGLQEGTNQIFGQIHASLDGDKAAFSIQEMAITLTESKEEAITGLPEIGGFGSSCSVSVADERYTIRHYIWSNEETEEFITSNDKGISSPSKEELIDVHPVEFDTFNTGKDEKSHSENIEMLLDVELDVLVELGRKTMLIKDVLKLGNGSIVELDKAAGEPLEVFVNGRKLAEGEVVVVDDHFGIRITQLAGPKERIMGLK